MKNALILFAKTPLANYSKTRLINPFSPEQAAEFYMASLADVYHTMHSSLHFDLLLSISPEKFDENLFPLPLSKNNHFFQQGEDLGKRMHNAFQFVFKKGYEKVAIIGSDYPHISEKIIIATFDHLKKFDCVLGPAMDGGYYLIGLQKLIESIFEDIEWSTEKVLSQTLEKAKESNLLIKNIEMQYDVDTAKEIKQLYHDLSQMDTSLKNFPQNVWQFMQKNKNLFL